MVSFEIPILLITYKKIDTTQKVLESIAAVKPERLFISSNAPDPRKETDREKVMELRSLIEKRIDWPCKVEKLYRTEHVGAGVSIASAVTWFFENVEEGIILEDDTLPDPSFFNFCKTMLEKYRNNENIKMISGNNFQNGRWRGDGSYYFSAYNHIWGWASWRRAWSNYSYTMDNLTEAQFADILEMYFSKKPVRDHWLNVFKNVKAGKVDTWDFQWTFSIWKANGISVLPNVNLVSNIGFGQEATHTTDSTSELADIKLQSLKEIKHPASIIIDKEADEFTSRTVFNIKHSLIGTLKNRIKKITGSFDIYVSG